MNQMRFLSMMGLILGLGVVLVASPAHAEEDGVVEFVQKVVDYPVRTVENLGGALNETGEGVGEGFDEFGAAAGDVLSGDVSRTPDMVVKPAGKTLETSGELVVDTAEAPFKDRE